MAFSPETLLSTAITLIVGGGGVKLIEAFLNRNRPKAEIDKTNADTEKVKADAASIQAEAFLKLVGQLERTGERLEIDVVNLRATIKIVEAERDALLAWKRAAEPELARLEQYDKLSEQGKVI